MYRNIDLRDRALGQCECAIRVNYKTRSRELASDHRDQSSKFAIGSDPLPTISEPADDLKIILLVMPVAIDTVERGAQLAVFVIATPLHR